MMLSGQSRQILHSHGEFNKWQVDGLFAPNDIITREEFVKIAVNAFGLFDSGATSEFEDVYDNTVGTACMWHLLLRQCIVNGIDSTRILVWHGKLQEGNGCCHLQNTFNEKCKHPSRRISC
jgi:hypothetical protein